MSKSRIPKELLPAATQIFTPDWVVRYMVENSLGRLWLEGHPDEGLRANWRYFMNEAEQTPEVAAKLSELRASCASLQPEAITVLDPCMGSGHILVYAFDVLMQIYRSVGYTDRDAVQSIVENNLYGLDIDDRAAQLAYFAVMMKACEYDRRFLRRGVQPHVCAIQEGAPVDAQALSALGAERSLAERLMQNFTDAKEYGSILHVNLSDGELARLSARLDALESAAHENLLAMADSAQVVQALRPLVNQAQILNRKYDIVVTNPPYLGSSRFSPKLNAYIAENYPEGKADLSTVMYMKAMNDFARKSGFVCFITISSWMFLSSFEKYRAMLLRQQTIVNLVDFGSELFEGKVGHNQIVAWVARNIHMDYVMEAVRLVDYNYSRREEKEGEFFNKSNRYTAQQDNFKKIPGSPIAYWVSERFISNFTKGSVSDTHFSGGRNKTHNNELYTRMWWEIADRIRWQPYTKGGDFRRWYGNMDTVVDWSIEAKAEYDSHGGLYRQEFVGKAGICWTLITSAKTAFRLKPASAHYDSGSPTIFNDKYMVDFALLGFLNSNVAAVYLQLLNPTINMGNTYVLSLPLLKEIEEKQVSNNVLECIAISKDDWETTETNWDFKKHPMI